MNTLRQLLQKNQMLIAALACVIVGIAVYVAIRQMIPSRGPTVVLVPFVDEETGETSMHPSNEVPPLIGSKGTPTVVRAYYSDSSDGTEKVLLYMTRFNAQAQEVLRRVVKSRAPMTPEENAIVERGGQYRLAAPNSPWLPASPDIMNGQPPMQNLTPPPGGGS